MICLIKIGLVINWNMILFLLLSGWSRKRISQRNKGWKTKTEVDPNIYTLPREEFDERQRRSGVNIHIYYTAEETDSCYVYMN